MFSAIRRYLARNKARDQLYRMSERELSDIGINRCDIERVVMSS